MGDFTRILTRGQSCRVRPGTRVTIRTDEGTHDVEVIGRRFNTAANLGDTTEEGWGWDGGGGPSEVDRETTMNRDETASPWGVGWAANGRTHDGDSFRAESEEYLR